MTLSYDHSVLSGADWPEAGAACTIPGFDLQPATTAVVLATGAGTLRASTARWDLPKPLAPVAGTPLVVRTLSALRLEGIERAVVVTGHAADAVEQCVANARGLAGLDVDFVRNADWRRRDGLSVLAARPLVGRTSFLLTTADHVGSLSIVAALRRGPLHDTDAVLAVDRRVDAVRDIEGRVRVRADEDGRVCAIAAGLAPFDAVFAGVALCGPSLFEALEEERWIGGGDCSSSGGFDRLARHGRTRAVDVPAHAWWYDIDTDTDLRAATLRAESALVGWC
jgi:NDP-sugar pyrophosphorylase family protein